MIKNLILDWSGTLVDDFSATLVATNKVFEHHELPSFTEEAFRRDFRLPYPEFYEEFLPEISLASLEVLFRNAFLEAESLVVPLEPTRAFLEDAAEKGIRLFVLSSMNEEALLRQAEDFGLTSFFEAIYAGVLDKREKMGEVMKKYRLQGEETAYVGDMVHDIDAARVGGVVSLALLSGYDPLERLAAAKPDAIFADVGHISKLLKAEELRPVRRDIRVNKLRVPVKIGVPDEERASEQELKLSLSLETQQGIAGLNDEITNTVDYFELTEGIKALARSKERKLIETLAEEIVDYVLSEFAVTAVNVEVEKPILQNCEGVIVSVEKRSSSCC